MAEDWSEFFPSALIEVKRTEQYGRGLYARAALRPGKEVLSRPPYAHVLDNSRRGAYCDACFALSDSLQKCAQCKFVHYCGRECQRGDWPLHQAECRGVAAIQPNAPPPSVRLVVRALHQRKKRGRREGLPAGAVWETDLLCTPREDQPAEAKAQLAFLVQAVSKLLSRGGRGKEFDALLAYQVLCKVICNTFSVFNDKLAPLGVGVYIGPSLVNHSCAPNCIAVFQGPIFHLRAIEDIAAGEQLFIGYVELLDTREKRQSRLSKVYNFDCACQRCTAEMAGAPPFHKLYSGADGVSQEESAAAVKRCWKLLEDIEEKHRKDRAAAVRLCRSVLGEPGRALHAMSLPRLKVNEFLFNSCLSVKDWTTALRAAEELTQPYESVTRAAALTLPPLLSSDSPPPSLLPSLPPLSPSLPPSLPSFPPLSPSPSPSLSPSLPRAYLPRYHLLRALHYFSLGKLYRLSDDTQDIQQSVANLTKALDALRIVYGAKHDVTKEALAMLQDSQHELVQRAAEQA